MAFWNELEWALHISTGLLQLLCHVSGQTNQYTPNTVLCHCVKWFEWNVNTPMRFSWSQFKSKAQWGSSPVFNKLLTATISLFRLLLKSQRSFKAFAECGLLCVFIYLSTVGFYWHRRTVKQQNLGPYWLWQQGSIKFNIAMFIHGIIAFF